MYGQIPEIHLEYLKQKPLHIPKSTLKTLHDVKTSHPRLPGKQHCRNDFASTAANRIELLPAVPATSFTPGWHEHQVDMTMFAANHEDISKWTTIINRVWIVTWCLTINNYTVMKSNINQNIWYDEWWTLFYVLVSKQTNKLTYARPYCLQTPANKQLAHLWNNQHKWSCQHLRENRLLSIKLTIELWWLLIYTCNVHSICIVFHISSKHSGFGISMTVCQTTHTDTDYYMSFAWDVCIWSNWNWCQMISYQSYSSNTFQRLQISKLIPLCLDLPSVPDLHLQKVEQHPWYHPSPNICIYGLANLYPPTVSTSDT